jgi:hypothetical protein
MQESIRPNPNPSDKSIKISKIFAHYGLHNVMEKQVHHIYFPPQGVAVVQCHLGWLTLL